mgnify:FL=1
MIRNTLAGLAGFGAVAAVVWAVSTGAFIPVPPPSIADGGAGGWTVLFDIDFTSMSATSFPTDGNYTIDGITFAKLNSANEVVPMETVPDAGLIIQPVQAAGLYETDKSAPMLLARLSLIPGFDTSRSIRLSAIVENNGTQNFDGVATGFVRDFGGPSDANVALLTGLGVGDNISASPSVTRIWDGTANSITGAKGANTLIMWVPGGWSNRMNAAAVYGFTSTTAFPDINMLNFLGGYSLQKNVSDTGGAFAIQMDSAHHWNIVITAGRAGASSPFSGVVKRLRFEIL